MEDILDIVQDLDFWVKYGLIISNFVVIIVIVIARRIKPEATGERKNILLVTAHPDDEAMFFVPSIVELRKDFNLYLICLSNGNADGLGKIREKELYQCCEYLGLKGSDCLNKTEFPDGMKNNWDVDLISRIVFDEIKKKNIHGVLTFDKNGVSGHLNHKCVYQGVQKMLENEEMRKYIDENKIKLYVNSDCNIIRKYIGFADFIISGLKDFMMLNLNPMVSYRAMKLHYSQFVWFRKLFVVFSRYTFFNNLRLLNPVEEQKMWKYNRQYKCMS